MPHRKHELRVVTGEEEEEEEEDGAPVMDEESMYSMLATPRSIMDHDQFFWFHSPTNSSSSGDSSYNDDSNSSSISGGCSGSGGGYGYGYYDEKKFSLRESALYRKIAHELRTGHRKVMDKRKQIEFQMVKNPTFIRKKDKYTFTVGVILTVSTTAIAFGFPFLLPAFYLFWCVLLLGARFFVYHRNHCMFLP